MSRITTPAIIDAAPAASHGLLEAVKKQLGWTPNLFRLVGVSPAALEGYLGMSGALEQGRVARANPRAHRAGRGGKSIAAITACRPTAIWAKPRQAGRRGNCCQPQWRLERRKGGRRRAVCRQSGHPARPRQRCRLCRRAGRWLHRCTNHRDRAARALNSWTNYFNSVFRTDIDFPVVTARESALRIAA